MHEYVTVSASSYDPASLASKLNEKSQQGWDVVAIVPTGGDVTAFLRRQANVPDYTEDEAAEAPMSSWEASAASAHDAALPETNHDAFHAASPASAPVTEPAGWAVAPETSTTEAPAAAAPTTVIQTASSYQPAQSASTTPAAPSVPAGWYADPAGRFDLRYWNGTEWTEHVARGGQQYTDPPVA